MEVSGDSATEFYEVVVNSISVFFNVLFFSHELKIG